MRSVPPVKAQTKCRLKNRISSKFKSILRAELTNPMVTAVNIWEITSEQLETIIGITIHQQWFRNIRPMVVTNNTLLLKAPNNFAARWLNTHYKQVIDALLMAQDKRLSCFFIADAEERAQKAPLLK